MSSPSPILRAQSAPAIPDSLRRLMAEIGPRWGTDVPKHVRMIVEEFSRLLAVAPKAAAVERDLAYGAHPRQVLDVYRPAATDQPAAGALPIVAFVHGGAFVDGQRDRSPEVYSNVSHYFARHGIIGVNVEYRLAPEHPYPSGSEDMGLAVAWLRKNAARFGGDPERIFLAGHSAGGAHIASYAYDKRQHPAEGHGVAGIMVLSGRVRAENLAENPNARKVEAYYGLDTSVYDDRSGVSHVSADSVPTMIAIAEYENPLIDLHCAELFYRLAKAKRHAPRIIRLAGHNHTSLIAHVNTAEDRLGSEMREFVRLGR